MKILVLSDSHGYLNHIDSAISIEKPDHVIHLGDHSADADRISVKYPYLPVVSVKGNCDFYDLITPELAILEYSGVRVMAVHGHSYNVKNSPLRLYMAAKEKAVHVALFGHTHCAFCEKKDNIWLLNPGTCGINSKGTYGIIHVHGGNVTCSIKTTEEEQHL